MLHSVPFSFSTTLEVLSNVRRPPVELLFRDTQFYGLLDLVPLLQVYRDHQSSTPQMPDTRLKSGDRTTTIIDHTALWATWPSDNSLSPARQFRTDNDRRFSHQKWFRKWKQVTCQHPLTTHPRPHLDHSQPARILTSTSARTVPGSCGSDRSEWRRSSCRLQSAWFRGDMQRM